MRYQLAVMSSAIEIVKPGTAPVASSKPQPAGARLTAVHAAPFVPNQSRAASPQPPGPYQEYDYHPQQVEAVYLDPQSAAYYTPPPPPRAQLDYHHYNQQQQQQQSFFLPPKLHLHLTNQLEATEYSPAQPDASTPDRVGPYNGLVRLDKAQAGLEQQTINNYNSRLYKAWNQAGVCVCLRRIVGFRVQQESTITLVDKWTRVSHPGLVQFHEAFTTKEFGDHSIVFVYDYHPLATTLYDAHLSPLASLPPNPWSSHQPAAIAYRSRAHPAHQQPSNGPGLIERVLWSYIVQLASVIKAVHHSGLAVRNLDPSRVIVTSKNRLRLAGSGILDVIAWDNAGPAIHQQDDLLALGKLIIALGCGSTSSVHNLPKSVDHISRAYSAELKNVVLYLLSKPGPRKSIDEVLALAGPRVLDELNSSLVAEDVLERELLREVENGRLVRLLTKFGFINERPESVYNPLSAAKLQTRSWLTPARANRRQVRPRPSLG